MLFRRILSNFNKSAVLLLHHQWDWDLHITDATSYSRDQIACMEIDGIVVNKGLSWLIIYLLMLQSGTVEPHMVAVEGWTFWSWDFWPPQCLPQPFNPPPTRSLPLPQCPHPPWRPSPPQSLTQPRTHRNPPHPRVMSLPRMQLCACNQFFHIVLRWPVACWFTPAYGDKMKKLFAYQLLVSFTCLAGGLCYGRPIQQSLDPLLLTIKEFQSAR